MSQNNTDTGAKHKKFSYADMAKCKLSLETVSNCRTESPVLMELTSD